MKNKSLFFLLHLFLLYFTLEEYPRWFTLSSVGILFLGLFNLPYKKYIAQILSVFLVGYHFYFYRKFFDPEAASALLAMMLYLKYLMVDSKKDFQQNLALSFLNIACFSLFNSSLFFILYLLSMSFFLLRMINQEANKKFRYLVQGQKIKDSIKTFLYGVPITLVLFFVFPRIPNFFPVAGSPQQGKIGYSQDIDNSSMSELQTSSQVAFRAEMKELPKVDLYWRGRILNQTNGYNWTYSPVQKIDERERGAKSTPISYNIKTEQSFHGDIITLDTPIDIITNLRYGKEAGHFYYSNQARKKISYSGLSELTSLQDSAEDESFLRLPGLVPNSLKAVLSQFEENESLEVKVEKFRQYILKEKFSYTLSPGYLPTMQDFLSAKKGFCTHYSSLMAIVFRHLGYPTRVVSGFQGGEYNALGGFYTVRSNDAHAWVEIYHNKKWLRFDPTSYISPLRIELGGDAFIEQGGNPASEGQQEFRQGPFYREYYRARQWIENLNFQVSLFIESFDLEKQQEFFDEIKEHLPRIAIGLLTVLLLILILIKKPYQYFFLKKEDKVLRKFQRVVKRKLKLVVKSHHNLNQAAILAPSLKEFVDLYFDYRYGNHNKQEKEEIYLRLQKIISSMSQS